MRGGVELAHPPFAELTLAVGALAAAGQQHDVVTALRPPGPLLVVQGEDQLMLAAVPAQRSDRVAKDGLARPPSARQASGSHRAGS